MDNVEIAGVGIHPFGRFSLDYRDLGAKAAQDALDDSGFDLSEIDFVLVGNVTNGMAVGHNIVEKLGRPGVAILDVEAACASSAGGLLVGSQLIEAGVASAILVIGVEKAARGFIAESGFHPWQIEAGLGVNPVYFALRAQELLDTTDATVEDLAFVSVKNHRHAVDNPNAMYRQAISLEDVLQSRMVCSPLTLLMLCAPNEGAAAAVLTTASRNPRKDQKVRVSGISLVSRAPNEWFVPAAAFQVHEHGDATRRAASSAYEAAGLDPKDIDVVECQDTDSASELLAYSGLGLCKSGEEAQFLRSGATTLGGAVPVNPSGGLLSKGEPLGASGLGQVYELVQQLRGHAGPRQVPNARVGVGHVMGAGGVASVLVLAR